MSPIYTLGKLVLKKEFTWNETVWNPSMITTALWLDAADSSTVTTVSGAVSQWNDKSGNGRNCSQSNASHRPVYGSNAINGKSAVEFSIASAAGHYLDGLSVAAFPLINRSIFYVIEETTAVISPGVFALAPNTGSDYNRTDALAVETRLIAGSTSLSYSTTLAGSIATPFSPRLYTEIKSAGTGTLSTNGGQLSTTDSSFTEFSSSSARGYLLGGRFLGGVISGANRLRGRIAEIIYVGSTVSLDTQQRIEGYLAHKWGLTANLPVGHPYKTVGPTPPAPPFDPNISQVSLLLHGDGTNGSTTITDSSLTPKTVTAVGNAQISTTQSKFGGASIAFDGTGDYLTVPSNIALNLSTGDWTIEYWVRSSNISATQGIIGRRSTAAARGLIVGFVSSKTILLVGDTNDTDWEVNSAGATTLSSNVWYHFAISRNGNTFKVFIDGSQESTATNSVVIADDAATLVIGANPEGVDGLNGYIDDLRITKGVARYTAAFTPPTAPFPNY